MIWDAIIFRLATPRRGFADIAAGDCLPLGTLEAVTSAVRAAFPDAQWVFPTCARHQLDGDTVMTIDLGYVVSSNTIHVSVDGPGNPLPDLFSLARANGWAVLDVATSQFIGPGYDAIRWN